MNPLMENFIAESRELIEQSTAALLILENTPDNKDTINELFRLIHTVKGASGILENIAPFTQLAHRLEDMLQKVRDGVLRLDSVQIDVLLGCCDQFLLWLEELEANEQLQDNAGDISQTMIAGIAELLDGDSAPSADPTPEPQSQTNSVSAQWLVDQVGIEHQQSIEALASHQTLSLIKYAPHAQCFFSGDDPLAWMSSIGDIQWRHIQFHCVTEPFDTYQCQLQFYVATLMPATEIISRLLPIEDQYQLYELNFAGQAEQDDQRIEYVNNIVDAQIQLLNEQPNEVPSRSGTLASIKTVYASLAGQISERPKQLPDDADEQQMAAYFAAITQGFIDKNTVIDMEDEPGRLLPEVGSVSEQIEKAKRKQIKTLKVDQEKVDLLMDLVGELIVAKNSMQYLAYRAESEFGVRKLAQDIKSEQTVISRLAEDLQSVVMQVRMVPLSTVFQRYPRLIRDISRKLGKQVDLIIEGEETEADKSIVEDLSEPLVHLIRNALDHGIEMPQERTAAGKNATGKITLCASTHDDNVIIKIIDDGRGINLHKVKQKALSQSLVDENKLERMSEQEILNLIFEPGFSTADAISDLSGRGVGMDSVRTAIERNGGSLAVHSTENQGSEVVMVLPLSMTISRVMMFELAGQSFAIPIENVIQTLKINRGRDVRKVKNIETFILRGETVPIINLKRVFDIEETGEPETEIQPLLVVRVGEEIIGLAVDKLQEGQDVIIKPLEGTLAAFSIYRGAAIMGDGRVLLVLNTEEVVSHAY